MKPQPFDSKTFAWIDDELQRLDEQGLRRTLHAREGGPSPEITITNSKLVNFASNDYLGLAADPRLARAATAATEEFGWGGAASPLICGRTVAHARLETALAEFEGTEAALVFPSGFAANCGTVAALARPGDVVFADRKSHASLLDGCRLSRADVRVFPHGDTNRLAWLLAKAGRYQRRLIVTDGLFSMDGDLAPLAEIAELADRFAAMLLVDEAHATGVFGSFGRGTCEHLGIEDRPGLVRVGTLSKALGSLGGFVAGPRKLIEWLVLGARPYMFSTAAPAAVAAAAEAALQIVRHEPRRREELLDRAGHLRQSLAQQGWNVGNSASQIVPLIVGLPDRAVALSAELRNRGLFVPAIRPPSVPEGESCLRISLTWGHTGEMIAHLLEALEQLRAQFP